MSTHTLAPASAAEQSQLLGILSSVLDPHVTHEVRMAASNAIEDHFANDDTVERLVITSLSLLSPFIDLSSASGAAQTAVPNSVRNLILVVLRQNIARGETDLHSRLSPAAQALLKSTILSFIASESSATLVSSCQNVAVRLAEVTLFKGEWDDLLPFVYSCASSASPPAMHRVALFFIESLADKCLDSLLSDVDTVISLLQAMLSPACELPTRAAAVRAACALAASDVPTPVTRALRECVPAFMATLEAALGAPSTEHARNIFEVLVELADSSDDVALFTPHVASIAAAMNSVVSSPQMEPAVRQFAMEFLVTIIIQAPRVLMTATKGGSAAKNKAAATAARALLSLSLGMACMLMMDVPESPSWGQSFSTSVADDDADGNSLAGTFAFYRIVHTAKKSLVRSSVVSTVTALLEAADWRCRLCGLSCFVSLQDLITLDQIPLRRIVESLSDAQPRVRAAAVDAIRGFSDAQAPKFQSAAHALVLPPLLSVLADASTPRVQAAACEALYSFISECPSGLLAPSVEAILTAAVGVASSPGYVQVRKEAIAILGAVGMSLQEDFAPFYPAVSATLKQVLFHPRDETEIGLRCRAIEAFTLIGTSVGRDVFAADAGELVNFYVSLNSSGALSSSDDDTAQFMLMAMVRVCSVVGAEFAPLLPVIMPQLLDRAAAAGRRRARRRGLNGARNKSIKLTAEGDIDEDCLPGPNSDDEDERGRGDSDDCDDDDDNPTLAAHKATSRALSAMEDEANILSMLTTFCTELRGLYAPYARATLAISTLYAPLSDAGQLQRTAIVLVPDLVRSVYLAAAEPPAPGTPEADAALAAGCSTTAAAAELPVMLSEALALLANSLNDAEDEDLEQVIIGSVFLLAEAAPYEALSAALGSPEAASPVAHALYDCAKRHIDTAAERSRAVAAAKAHRAAASGKKGVKKAGAKSAAAAAAAEALAVIDDLEPAAHLARMSAATLAARNQTDDTISEHSLQALATLARIFGPAFAPMFAGCLETVVEWVNGTGSRSATRRVGLMFLHSTIEQLGEFDTASSSTAATASVASELPTILTVGFSRLRADAATGNASVVERAAYLIAIVFKYCSSIVADAPEVVDSVVAGLGEARQALRECIVHKFGEEGLVVAGAGAEGSTAAAAAAVAAAAAGEDAAADDEDEVDEDDDDDEAENDDHGGSIDPELEMLHYAIDNITGALGNIACLVNHTAAAELWLNALPMQVDWTEADWTYSLLCTHVEANTPSLAAGGQAALARIVQVLEIAEGSQYVEEAIRARAAALRARITGAAQ